MTISNGAFQPYIYEISYEAVDGTFSGKFLHSLNGDTTYFSSPSPVYIDAQLFLRPQYSSLSTGGVPESPFINFVLTPAVARIRKMHGDVPINLEAVRVYVTPATYSTTP